MLFGYFTLFVALMISAVAEFYSIVGLTAIFSAAFWPVVIMGACLGVGKITAAVWLKLNWERASWTYKLYLVPAVAFLMVLTSMGIFGYLSKAHSDQSLVSGDVIAKIAVYDEKIKIEKENIDANRKALKQLDEAVDQIMGRSTTETGADKAVAVRRGQQKERGRLQQEIAESQKRIAAYNEERAPIAAEVRKVEAEVGPIKYIAALVYGDNPDANLLEAAVRWVIILIVAVFDPLALVLILAAQQSLRWAREEPKPTEQDWKARTEELLDIFKDQPTDLDPEEPKTDLPYLKDGAKMFFPNLKPMVAKPEPTIYAGNPADFQQPWPEEKQEELVKVMQEIFPNDEEETPEVQEAIRLWKTQNPNDTLKHQRTLLARGLIDELPWMKLVATPDLPRQPTTGFGIAFPADAVKGDTFVRVDKIPNLVYKFNGNTWYEVDKTVTDSYTYDTAYIDHLIEKIDRGEYDPDLLSDSEREQVAQRLQQNK
jgi:hypothetical protein